MRVILILLMLATQAQAGETYPALPAGARIGYLVAVPDAPMYALSQGGSYSAKPYPAVTWQLRQSMEEAIATSLTQAGLVPVDLAPVGAKAGHIEDLLEMDGKGTIQKGNLRWRIPESHQAIVDKLRKELDLAAVIFVTDTPRAMFPFCAGCIGSFNAAGGGLVVEKYGLIGFKTVKVRAIASFRWNVYTLAVPADYARDEDLFPDTEVSRVKLTPESKVADVDNPTAAEFEPVREDIAARARGIATKAAKLLVSGFPAAANDQASGT
jgi:hypothetical protein